MEMAIGHYKSICSSRTIYSHDKGYFREFCESTKQVIGTEYVSHVISEKKSNQDWISRVLNDVYIKSMLMNIFNQKAITLRNKDALISRRRRLQSLYSIRSESSFNILNQLNQAVIEAPEIGICSATDDGYTLPLASITRADFLMKQHEFISAYQDLKTLMKFGVPFINIEKISQKIVSCRSTIQNWPSRYFDTGRLPCEQDPLVECSFVATDVTIKESTISGKEAIADRTINPGHLLVAENAIASCLLPQNYLSHCQTCLKRHKISYGCTNCSCVSYCSYGCRDSSLQTSHKYECKILPTINGSGLSIISHLALRIVTQLGLDRCTEIYWKIHSANLNGESTSPRQNKYLELYDLVDHTSLRTDDDVFERVLVVGFLTSCLKQVNFFKKIENSCGVKLKGQ